MRIRPLLSGLLFLAALVPATADEMPAGAARGKAITEKWCGLCHAEAGTPPPRSEAPVFADVVRRPGRDADYLAKFLKEDHFPMTTYRLFDHEKDDVAAFIHSLRRR